MTVPSFFQVDPSRGEPLYQQLADAIVRAVAAGAIRAGEPLPSVRDVATELRINLNTVSKAYRRLQDQGVAELQRGVGVFIAEDSTPARRRARLEQIAGEIRELAVEAVQLRLTDDEVVERLLAALKKARREQGKKG